MRGACSMVFTFCVEVLSMNDDDDEDMIFSFVFVAVTIFTVLFSVAGAVLVVWSLI